MGLFTCALLASLEFARTVQKIQIEILIDKPVVRQLCKSHTLRT